MLATHSLPWLRGDERAAQQGCNPTHRSLQPHASQPATLCDASQVMSEPRNKHVPQSEVVRVYAAAPDHDLLLIATSHHYQLRLATTLLLLPTTCDSLPPRPNTCCYSLLLAPTSYTTSYYFLVLASTPNTSFDYLLQVCFYLPLGPNTCY